MTAAERDLIEEAFRDWRARRAYVDTRGTYWLKDRIPLGAPIIAGAERRRMAPWSRTVKRYFPTVDEFHRAAREANPPALPKARVRFCPRIDEERRQGDARAYAHVGHHDGIICVARAFERLPERFKLGILYHEAGHLLLDDADHSEAEADEAAERTFGVRIVYRDSAYGPRLQYVA